MLALKQPMHREEASTLKPFDESMQSTAITIATCDNALTVETNFELNEDNMPVLLEWFGLEMFANKFKTISQITGLLGKQRWSAYRTSGRFRYRHTSLLDPFVQAPIDFSQQATRFRHLLVTMQRYDFMLNELRQEQQASNSFSIEYDGKHLPSALRAVLDQRSMSKSRTRILETMSEIAPHISTMSVSSLQSGKEYVAFLEATLGRPVESWESSDGTLRALAILVALETHPSNSTIIIEEPERDLHPWAVRSLMKHIREVMDTRRLQVILTTHSPQVLEEVSPTEVIVASRTPEHGTKLTNLKHIVPHGNIDMGEIGRMWVKGLLGGVPTHGSSALKCEKRV